ncbi:hypothetical protein ACFPK9_10460 [Rubritalea spongiae]|uniref:AsmA family protein n=1 Tax=Rubritalea spongiae TaxID=430797 RepID=A0ABW5E4Q3_9BACT
MKKWMIGIALAIIVLLIAVTMLAKFLLTKDFLVKEIESSINSRVQIGSVDVALFSFPTKVSLNDVILVPRDEIVAIGTPYGDRLELLEGDVELKSLSFKLSLWELLSRKIHVEHFDLDGLHVRASLFEDGTNSLDPLFASPEAEAEKQVEKAEGFNAKEQKQFVTYLDSVDIRNVSFDLEIEKTGLFIHGSECGVSLENIRVDPQALEKVNEASIQFTSKVEVFDSPSKKLKYGELGLAGPAIARLFDPVTGDIDPIVSLDFSISENSHINTQVPYLQKIWKYSEKLSKFGVSIGTLPDRATFGRNRKLKGSYQRGRVDISEDVSILLHDWEVALNQPSWLESGDDTHEFFVDFSASKKASDSMVRHIDQLVGKVPKEIRGNLAEEIHSDWIKNGKLTVSLHTSGVLSSPKIEMRTKVPDIDTLIKEYAKKSALDYLFKKLKK